MLQDRPVITQTVGVKEAAKALGIAPEALRSQHLQAHTVRSQVPGEGPGHAAQDPDGLPRLAG